jgi:hypothetical protein
MYPHKEKHRQGNQAVQSSIDKKVSSKNFRKFKLLDNKYGKCK